MKKSALSFLLVGLMAAPAMAGDGNGLSTGLDFVYSSITGVLDTDGEQQDLEDLGLSLSSVLINVNAEYNLMDGLYLGLDLPIVQNSTHLEGDMLKAAEAAGVDTSFSSMGLGDLSLYAGYMYGLSNTMHLGGELRFKAATGTDDDLVEDDERGTGSGHHNIQASLLVDMEPVDNLGIDIEVGYLMQLATEKEVVDGAGDIEVDPADGLYTNLGIGFTIADMLTPTLGIHYFTTGEDKAAGVEEEDSDRNALSLSFKLGLKISDMLSAHVGVGSNQITVGRNLPYGYALTGKNVPTGLSFNAGVNARF